MVSQKKLKKSKCAQTLPTALILLACFVPMFLAEYQYPTLSTKKPTADHTHSSIKTQMTLNAYQ
jgi:hypothetical protein